MSRRLRSIDLVLRVMDVFKQIVQASLEIDNKLVSGFLKIKIKKT